MPKVNHEILRWARKTSGLELDKAAKKIGLRQTKDTSAVDRLKELESGKADPSRPLLLRMSKQYHRPLVVFYMSNVPRKGDRGKDFRTLPADYTEVDDVLIDVLLRNIHARQNMFRSVLEEDDDIKPLPFVGSASIEDDIQSLTSDMYKVLDFNIEEFRAQSSPHEAFNLLRTKAEAAGVFVLLIGNLGNYHTNIDINNFPERLNQDELCKCGHPKMSHIWRKPSTNEIHKYKSDCGEQGCKCKDYTLQNKSETEGKEI